MIAREGRAAQVRLAPKQPKAYQAFGHTSNDAAKWEEPRLPESRRWVMRPARKVLPMTRQPLAEVPVRSAFDHPRVGDEVFLLGEGAVVVGPWVIIAKTSTSLQSRPDQHLAGEKLASPDPRMTSSWLQVRPSEDLIAALHPDPSLSLAEDATTVAKPLEAENLKNLHAVARPAADVLAEVADVLRQEDAEDPLRRVADLGPYDPFDDIYE